MPALLRRIILFALIAAALAANPPATAKQATAPNTASAAMPVPEDRFWDDRFGPPGSPVQEVWAAVIGPGGDLYVGGESGVGRWDGRRWHKLGANPPTSNVYALAFVGDTLYAGGRFASAGGSVVHNLARWDGTSWSGVGGGVTHVSNAPQIMELHARDGRLHVVGYFDRAGGSPANGWAVWDGSAWVAPEGGGAPGAPVTVEALAFEQGRLYASAIYTETGSFKTRIMSWNGAAWSQLGLTFESDRGRPAVSDLQLYAGQLHISGGFYVPGESAISYVARWNGTRWQGIGNREQVGWGAYDMTVRGGLLHVGTFYTSTGPLLRTWNGSVWERSGPSIYGAGRILTFAQTASTFYVAGYVQEMFNHPQERPRVFNHIAQQINGEWRPLGEGVDSTYNQTMAPVGDDLYLFDSSGGNRVWDGNSWRVLSRTFLPGAPASDGRTLYSNSGTTVVRRDGDSWAPIGTANATFGLLAGASGVYIIGGMTEIDGVAVTRMARWDGANWHPVGNAAANGPLSASHVTAGGIYIAGNFSAVGGVSANHIARWDGSAWRALGGGIPETAVDAIVGSDSALYVKSSTGANAFIRRWDGAAWTTVVTTTRDELWGGLAVLDGDLIVSGSFASIGGVAARNIARWDGAAWHPLGSGLDQAARSMAVSGHNLYAAGGFATAGGLPSQRFAHWNATRTPLFIPAILK